jgi:hypothetical protein
LHTLTGISLFGEDATKRPDWKKLRGDAKGTNFALCYGGGGTAVINTIGCDKNEGWRIKEQFDKTYLTLAAWWKSMHEYVKRHKFVITAFGRRYHLPDIDHELSGIRAKAERNSTNGPIQGTSADITKIAMGLIYKECKKRGWLDKAHMLITMHDELVFEIDLDILEEAIDLFVGIMCRNNFILKLGWMVPLTSDVEMGYNWTVPWDPELNGCFKGVGTQAKKEADAKAIEAGKPAELPDRVYKLRGFTLGEVESIAQLIFAGQTAPVAKLRVMGPDGEDLTSSLSAVWGGKLPKVGA